MRLIIGFLLLCISVKVKSAEPDKIYNPNIKSVQLFQSRNAMSYPIIKLGEINSLRLEFDELGTNIQSYYYTFQLCNANWQPVDLSSFDYIRGFTQNRISTYRVSSIAKTQYVHYSASLPDRSGVPTKTGNYLLKVFANGDTSQLIFTRRFLVTDNSINVGARMVQAFNPQFFRTHHKIQFTIDQTKLNVVNVASQIKVVVLQNWRWDNAITGVQPTFIKNNLLEYSGENDFVFPAGNEYNWADLRSFRFQSERMASVDRTTFPWTVNLVADKERKDQRYMFHTDINGFYEISTTDNVNPLWQSDYANVNFTFVPVNNSPLINKDIYISGQFNCYQHSDDYKMIFNAEKGVYEKVLFLKQGYYDYMYTAVSRNNGVIENTGENYWDTENEYTILVYYQSLSGRSDELISATTINSKAFISKGLGL